MLAKSQASQTPWQDVVTVAIYSASQEDRATTFCFADYQVIGLPPRKKMTPLVLLPVSMSPAMSALL
jgi:hypothetical protein